MVTPNTLQLTPSSSSQKAPKAADQASTTSIPGCTHHHPSKPWTRPPPLLPPRHVAAVLPFLPGSTTRETRSECSHLNPDTGVRSCCPRSQTQVLESGCCFLGQSPYGTMLQGASSPKTHLKYGGCCSHLIWRRIRWMGVYQVYQWEVGTWEPQAQGGR